MIQILKGLIPYVCRPFVDNIGVKDPKTDYSGEEAALGIRRFVLEHIINLNRMPASLKREGWGPVWLRRLTYRLTVARH